MTKQDTTEHYKHIYSLVLHESKAVWDTGQLFLIANTFLAAIIGTNFPVFSTSLDSAKKIIFLVLALLGLTISVLWYFSFERTKKYYRFRMAQAREFEKVNHLIPVFSGDVQRLAKGETIQADSEDHNLRVFGWNLSSLDIVKYVIILFVIFYSFILSFSVISFQRDSPENICGNHRQIQKVPIKHRFMCPKNFREKLYNNEVYLERPASSNF